MPVGVPRKKPAEPLYAGAEAFASARPRPRPTSSRQAPRLILSVPATLRRAGREMALVVGAGTKLPLRSCAMRSSAISR